MDFQLTEQEKALRGMVRDFGQRHIGPGLLEREWEMDPVKRMPWDMVEAASAAGLRTLTVPPEYGGPDPALSQMARVVAEELGAADPGFPILWGHQIKDPAWVAYVGTKEQKDWFFPEYVKDPRYLVCTANTEPAHGSDWQLPYPGFHGDTTAVLDGDEWVVNGAKVSVSNAHEARLIILNCCTDPTVDSSRGTSSFLVPRGPGIDSSVHPKVGMRLCNNARISFDNVRIPKHFLFGELHGAEKARRARRGESPLLSAAAKVGLTRSPFEEAVEYAKQRVQGGKPIIEHQAVGVKLAECYALLEAQRAMTHRLAWMIETGIEFDDKYASALIWYGTEATYRAATLAMQVCGCGGGWLSLSAQKHVRDALVHFPNDGNSGTQLLKVHQMLQDRPTLVSVW